MKLAVSPAHLDGLFKKRDYGELVWLVSLMEGSDRYDRGKQDDGLPQPLFLVAEMLVWFAQATRSGAWTYFEVVSSARGEAMHAALKTFAPDFAAHYALGLAMWSDEASMSSEDEWTEANELAAINLMWDLLATNRAILEATIA